MSYKLLDESTVESAIKTYLKELIDKGFYNVEITEFNVDIQNIIEQIPNVAAVPLDVHERMKRELNSEINVYAAMAKSAVDKLDAILEERNQAVADLRKYAQCDTCKHNGDVICSAEACKDGDRWEWRGIEEKESALSESTKTMLLEGFMKGVE